MTGGVQGAKDDGGGARSERRWEGCKERSDEALRIPRRLASLVANTIN